MVQYVHIRSIINCKEALQMAHKIIICGGNGAGKSTLGKALAAKTGWEFRDVEDYYFPKTDPDYLYAVQRTQEEVVSLLYDDLNKYDDLIFASVRGNYSEQTAAMFTCAVFVSVPKETRMKRVRQRAYDKFGDRVCEGGDLYEREKAFYDLIEKRTDKIVTDWLDTMDIPVIRVDGTKPIEENIGAITDWLMQTERIQGAK